MFSNKQIGFIDIRNSRQGKKLLQKHTQASGIIDKSSYSNSMDNRVMQKKFGKCVEMSANTWILKNFRRFLEDIPNSIWAFQTQIKEKAELITENEERIYSIDTGIKKQITEFITAIDLLKQVLVSSTKDIINLQLDEHYLLPEDVSGGPYQEVISFHW